MAHNSYRAARFMGLPAERPDFEMTNWPIPILPDGRRRIQALDGFTKWMALSLLLSTTIALIFKPLLKVKLYTTMPEAQRPQQGANASAGPLAEARLDRSSLTGRLRSRLGFGGSGGETPV